LIPWLAVSIIAVFIHNLLASFNSLCNKKTSGLVILESFVYSSSHIMIFTVENIKIFSQFAINHLAIILQVVVFQFVPVTQIIFIFLLGKP
jgi:hypothetical protein